MKKTKWARIKTRAKTPEAKAMIDAPAIKLTTEMRAVIAMMSKRCLRN